MLWRRITDRNDPFLHLLIGLRIGRYASTWLSKEDASILWRSLSEAFDSFFDPAEGSTDPGGQLLLRPLWMKPLKPIEHRPISYPTFLHFTHSFQEKPFLSEVYLYPELHRLLAGLRGAETPRVMTIESHAPTTMEDRVPFLPAVAAGWDLGASSYRDEGACASPP